MKTDNCVISINNLVKNYPMGNTTFPALKNISIDFLSGEFTGLVGPSGSGKTTLLNIIGSLDKPSFGNVDVLNFKIEKLSAREGAELRNMHLGFIFQTYNLLPVYTVYENIELPLILLKIPEKKRKDMVMEAIEWVHLTDKVKSRPAQLSGGQSQRVAIARAIVKKPQIILADEPTANLDAENSHNILKLMLDLNEKLETTFIFATHDEKVIQYLRRKIHLNDGEVKKDEVLTPVSVQRTAVFAEAGDK